MIHEGDRVAVLTPDDERVFLGKLILKSTYEWQVQLSIGKRWVNPKYVHGLA